jgi:hypothetical protein
MLGEEEARVARLRLIPHACVGLACVRDEGEREPGVRLP